MYTDERTAVVVVEQRSRRRGLLWVAAGAVLALAGGTTLALWSAEADFSGGTITAGDLNLVAADASFWDVSGDRLDATTTLPGTDGSQLGHSIEPETWRIVPGDKVAYVMPVEVTLEGDNLVAELVIDGFGDIDGNNGRMEYSYEVYVNSELWSAEEVFNGGQVSAGDDHPLLYLSAPLAGQSNGGSDARNDDVTVYEMSTNPLPVTVVVYGTYDDQTPDRETVTVADVLDPFTLRLEQVRDTGAQFDN